MNHRRENSTSDSKLHAARITLWSCKATYSLWKLSTSFNRVYCCCHTQAIQLSINKQFFSRSHYYLTIINFIPKFKSNPQKKTNTGRSVRFICLRIFLAICQQLRQIMFLFHHNFFLWVLFQFTVQYEIMEWSQAKNNPTKHDDKFHSNVIRTFFFVFQSAVLIFSSRATCTQLLCRR